MAWTIINVLFLLIIFVLVKKADGTLEEFEPKKIMRTCMRSGLDEEKCELVLKEVEKNVYDKISTRDLLKIVLKEIRKYDKPAGMRYNLRAAFGELCDTGLVFEEFVKRLLDEYGYETELRKIISGKCVEHEIDVLALKNGEKILVECKHHKNFHTYTGLHVGLALWARLQDLNEGNKKFSGAWLVCNTKFSDQCIKYCECRKLKIVGWSYPHDSSLQNLIESKKLYPITIITDLKRWEKEKLFENGIITIKDMIKADIKTLQKETGIPIEGLQRFSDLSKRLFE